MNINSPVTDIKGIGSSKAGALSRLGIFTVGDLLNHFPKAYQNRGAVTTVSEAAMKIRLTGEASPSALILTVGTDAVSTTVKKGIVLTKFKAFDESGVCDITFFNQGYLKDTFRKGTTFRFWCRPTFDYGRLQLSSPAYEMCIPGKKLDSIVPVYPLTRGISQKLITALIKEAMKYAISPEEHLPADVLVKNGICSLQYAIKNIHFPESLEALYSARKRFEFDRTFCTATALAMKGEARNSNAPAMLGADITPILSALPFTLTNAQARAVSEISADMSHTRQMRRILCGDVGSGKTAVAAVAAYIAVSKGYQCALMVPTEILAKQHYAELAPIFARLGYKTALLTGSLKPSDKKRLQSDIGRLDDPPMLVIGTHALITDNVTFRNLGLIITDEQHRFGANQRAALSEKSQSAHTLVMSATPIPRTLSLVYFGDLDRSVLDELPPGRLKVGTFTVDESYRARLNGFIRKQAQEGHRTYVVCPAIEESEPVADDPDNIYDIDFSAQENSEPPLKGAIEYAAKLSAALPELRIGFVHGKLKTVEKDAVMSDFAEGRLDVLVSTTVIEVGVNVPEATLMVVENAERFGLSQLHQLRGRVGRGRAKSYCILVSDTKNEVSKKRLDIMCKLSDGYLIAEEDLKMRGPGDFFANGGIIRQSGASVIHSSEDTDGKLWESAINAAKALIDSDPSLSDTKYRRLHQIVTELLKGSENTIS